MIDVVCFRSIAIWVFPAVLDLNQPKKVRCAPGGKMDERVCPRCGREGTIIVGARSTRGFIHHSFQCRVCRYSWTEDPPNALGLADNRFAPRRNRRISPASATPHTAPARIAGSIARHESQAPPTWTAHFTMLERGLFAFAVSPAIGSRPVPQLRSATADQVSEVRSRGLPRDRQEHHGDDVRVRGLSAYVGHGYGVTP